MDFTVIFLDPPLISGCYLSHFPLWEGGGLWGLERTTDVILKSTPLKTPEFIYHMIFQLRAYFAPPQPPQATPGGGREILM